MAVLKKRETLAKKKAIEEFKSSDDFQEAVVTSASTYFGGGVDFCKRQLVHHHPNLGINLDIMDMNWDMLEREEAKAEETKNKGGWRGGDGEGQG